LVGPRETDPAPGGDASRAEVIAADGLALDNAEFTRLIEYLRLGPSSGPLVVNNARQRDAAWPFPEVREFVICPIGSDGHHGGWMAAFNHRHGDAFGSAAEFGSAEVDLLCSVSAILGIHGGNTELYRNQNELLSGIVRALTSAIDAKDPYTCGHSDRVARVAVRLAQELGCPADVVETIYLSGLLHDVGKIGIDDNVLRKPGRLTEAEFEHIKTHARIGHNILVDIKQLGQVLPVVLHHHESWDGRGYPDGLGGETIPWLARIVAVADAFDAMGSDRPYRRGMAAEKLDEVLRKGAGQQWDPQVIDAYFRARADIGEIGRSSCEPRAPESPDLPVYI
jgi:HD-GYP domain-containing protein (c-di-GMP phosphodiesterase class II)